jgi:predicted metal-binding membrane protein
MVVSMHKRSDPLLLAFSGTAIVYPYLLISVAWIVLLVAFAFHQNEFFNHDFLLGTSHYAWGVAAFIFLISWQFMTIAMMLPSVLPLLVRMASVDSRYCLWIKQACFIGGYALSWTAFALLAFLNDTLLHWLVSRWWWLYFHSWIIGAVLLTLAGCFQLSPFKARCLQQCCLLSRWCDASNDRRATHRATWLCGIHYGCYCIGSCWAMMLVLFGLGMSSLLWMIGATVVIAAEKIAPGRSLSLLLAGVFFLLAILWCVFSTVS